MALSWEPMWWRNLAVGVALGLGCITATPALAQRSAEPDLAAIGELAQEAQTRFETADYAGAIDLWTEAYAALPQESEYAQQRSVLVYQIAQACVEAYALDPQVLYLRKAERLYTSYQETIDPSDAETLAEVESTIAELRAKIAVVDPDPETEGDPKPDPGAGEAQVEDQSIGDEGDGSATTSEVPSGEPSAGRSDGRGLTIAGAVLVGLGAASLGAMTYGLVWGGRVDDRGDAAKAAGETDAEVYRGLLSEGTTANRLAIGAGVAGAVAVATGATLLGVGLGKRRTRSSERDIAWAPLGVARGGGLALRLRF